MASKQKSRRRWLLPPCDRFDVERIESWLQDMAKEGWLLDKSADIWFGFFPFRQSAPQDAQYRLEPKRHSEYTNAPDDEEEDLYRQYGWEFVATYDLFYIYRTADPNARELNTDLAVQATALKSVKRNSFSVLLLQLWLVGFWFFRIWNEIYRFLVTFGWFVVPVAVFMLVAVLVIDGKRFLHIRRLQKNLKDSIPLDHNKPWRKNAKRSRVSKITVILLYAYVVCLIFASCLNTTSQSLEPTPTAEYPGDPPFVTCADLGSFAEEKFMNYNTYNQFSSSLAPNIVEWKEFGTIRTADGRVIDGSLSIDYYETVSPVLARGLVDDFLYQYEKYKDFQIIEAPDIDADYVVAFNYIFPTVLIQKDNIFICATVGLDYQEEYLLEEWAQQMADYLQK